MGTRLVDDRNQGRVDLGECRTDLGLAFPREHQVLYEVAEAVGQRLQALANVIGDGRRQRRSHRCPLPEEASELVEDGCDLVTSCAA
ncbi:hypothetical protein DQP55_24205 [Mycolicibacterium sp. GF69]|nr:hypothetical protein DQP55_24205 [Mycolicibacterium sp. GF69]